MNIADIISKTMAVTLVMQKEGKTEQVIVVDGVVQEKDGMLALLYDADSPLFQLEEAWLGRIGRTPEAVKEILGDCEFSLTLYGGPLPENADLNDYIRTGLKLSP